MKSIKILGFNISFPEKDEETYLLTDKNQGYYIFANSNTLVEAKNNNLLDKSLKKASFILPDGFPLVLAARFKGIKGSRRLSGPDFTLRAIKYLEKNKLTCCFYGGSRDESKIREEILRAKFPKLKFYSFSEKEEIMKETLRKNKIKFLFISTGSPKQEIWAYKNHKEMDCKISCVGIAIPYILGERKRAPILMQKYYLEWLYRLITEPRKSWKRYLINGPKFIMLSLNEILLK